MKNGVKYKKRTIENNMPLLYNKTGRTINFVIPGSGKEILLEDEQVLDADDKLAKILLKEFPRLNVLNEKGDPSIVSEDEESLNNKGGDPEIEKIKNEERYVCSTCDEHFGKGEHSAFRKHLKKHE